MTKDERTHLADFIFNRIYNYVGTSSLIDQAIEDYFTQPVTMNFKTGWMNLSMPPAAPTKHTPPPIDRGISQYDSCVKNECECGAAKVGSNRHSAWCPKHSD